MNLYARKMLRYLLIFVAVGGCFIGGIVHIIEVLSKMHGLFAAPTVTGLIAFAVGAGAGAWLARGAVRQEDRGDASHVVSTARSMASMARDSRTPGRSLTTEGDWSRICRLLDRLAPETAEGVIGHCKDELEEVDPELRVAPVSWTLQTLAGHPPVAWDIVRAIHLRRRGLDANAVATLVQCPHLSAIVALDLSENPVGDAGLGIVTASPLFGRMVTLSLCECGLTDRGLEALAIDAPRTKLHTFHLVNNPAVTAAGLRALERTPFVAALRQLTTDQPPEGAPCTLTTLAP